MALAHAIASGTEAAYRRGDLFDKRREAMELWAAFVNGAPANVASKADPQTQIGLMQSACFAPG